MTLGGSRNLGGSDAHSVGGTTGSGSTGGTETGGKEASGTGSEAIKICCTFVSGFVGMFHRYDYMSLFVSFFDILVSLDNLFQRIASIYMCSYYSRLN